MAQQPAAADRYRTLLEVSRAVSAHHDLRALFRDLSTLLRQVVHFDFLNLVLYDAQLDAMRLHVLESTDGSEAVTKVSPLPVDESPAGTAWREQRDVIIADTQTAEQWPIVMNLLRSRGVQGCCYLPLTTAQRRLGAIGFGYSGGHRFDSVELNFLHTVAAQVAVAVDNALGHDELQVERDRLQLLLDVTNTLVSSLEPRELFDRIAESLRAVIPHDYVSLALVEPDKRALILQALERSTDAGVVEHRMIVPDEAAPARTAIAERRVVTLDEEGLRANPTQGCIRLVGEGIRTLACFPLITRNATLGSLNIGMRSADPMSPSDIAVLQHIAHQVAIALENAISFREISALRDRLAQEKLYLEQELRTDRNFSEMVGESDEFRRILKQIETVAPTPATVLILGETGTGKELIARAIHQYSDRASRTFVKLNCAAIPTGLLESELFGHEKGAFTGAIQQKVGRLELADQGTLFLDEVGDIPLELQPKLLRAIQEREFERLGSNRTQRVDIRLVAATNRDIQRMVSEREFRADLYYRLNVFPIHVPPLRDRPEDIPLLVRYFAQKFSRRMNRKIETIPAEMMARLTRYSWPGNIRELENLIERAVILSPGPVLAVPEPENAETEPSRSAIPTTLEAAEREHIVRILDETNWVLAGPNGAANRLGLKRSTLQSRMKKLGISRPRPVHR